MPFDPSRPAFSPESLTALRHFYNLEEQGGDLSVVPQDFRTHALQMRAAGRLPGPGTASFDAWKGAFEGEPVRVAVDAPADYTSTTSTPSTVGMEPGTPLRSNTGENVGGLVGALAGPAAMAPLAGAINPLLGIPLALLAAYAGGNVGGQVGSLAQSGANQLQGLPPAETGTLPERLTAAGDRQGQQGVIQEAGGRALGLVGATAGKVVKSMPTAVRARSAAKVTEAAKPVNLTLRDAPTLERIGAAKLPPGTTAPSGRFVGTALGGRAQAEKLGATFHPDAVAKSLDHDPDFVRTLHAALQPAERAALDTLTTQQSRLRFWKGIESTLTDRLVTLGGFASILGGYGAAVTGAQVANKLLSSKPAQRLATALIDGGLQPGAEQATRAALTRLVMPKSRNDVPAPLTLAR